MHIQKNLPHTIVSWFLTNYTSPTLSQLHLIDTKLIYTSPKQQKNSVSASLHQYITNQNSVSASINLYITNIHFYYTI